MITIINTETGVNEVFEDLAAAQAFASEQNNPSAWSLHQRGVISPLALPGAPEAVAAPVVTTDAVEAEVLAAPVAKPAPAKRSAKAK